MDGTNVCESSPGPSVIESSANFKTDEDSMVISAGEVSDRIQQTYNPTSSNGENTKDRPKSGKLSSKKKKTDHPPTSKKEVKKASRKRNSSSTAASPSAVEISTNLSTDEDSLEIEADEVSNKKKLKSKAASSNGKKTKKPDKEGKISSKRKKSDQPPTSLTEDKITPRKRNRASVADSPSAVEYSSNFITDESTMGTQEDEVSNKIKAPNNPTNSDENNAKKPAKKAEYQPKRNKPDPLPMCEMVDALKALRKRNVASVVSSTSVVQCSKNLEAQEDSMRIQSSEVSKKKKTSNNPAKSSDAKNTKKLAKDKKNSQRKKKPDQLLTSQTVVVKANTDLENGNTDSVEARPSVVESAPRHKTDENFTKNKADEVSNKIKETNDPASSDKKNYKVPANRGKLSVKRKISDNPPTSQMVMEALTGLKKRNGASVDTILEYMERQYRVNTKLVKRYVTRYMNSAVQKGIIEKSGGTGDDERFKIKRAEKVAKGGKK